MSVRMMTLAWDVSGLTAPEKLVLLALADHAGDDGRCWPSMSRIAAKSDMTPRGARGIVRRLETAGLVRTEQSPGRRVNVYRLTINPERPSEPNAERGAGSDEQRGTTFRVNPEHGSYQPGTRVPPNHHEPSEVVETTTTSLAEDNGDQVVVVPALGLSPEDLIAVCEPVASGASCWRPRAVADFIADAASRGWSRDDILDAGREARASLGDRPMRSTSYLAGVLKRHAEDRAPPVPEKPAPEEGFAAKFFQRRSANG